MDAAMIRGVAIRVTTAELAAMFEERAKVLDAKADESAKRAARHEKAAAGVTESADDEDVLPSETTVLRERDRAKNCRSEEAGRRARAKFARFCAAHLPAGSTFEVEVDDLARLGLAEGVSDLG